MFSRSQLLRPRSKRKTGGRHARVENLEPRLVLDGAAEFVADLNTMPFGRGADGDFDYAWLGNELFFVADDGTGDVELWKSDGTETGTVRVKDIRPGSQGSFPTYMVATEDRIFFTAYDDSHGRELWITDGTERGTTRVTDLMPGGIDSFDSFNSYGIDQELLAVEGRLFFSFDGELWASDGTEAGTKIVKDINPGAEGSYPAHLTDVNGQLYFVAADADARRLWQSDGTERGTLPVDHVPPEFDDPSDGMVSVGTDLFYRTRLWSPSQERYLSSLWKVDLSGTESPTLLHDGWTRFGRESGSITRVGDLIFFKSEGEGGEELWRTDGTETGTFRIETFDGIGHLMAVGEEVFFRVSDQWINELWRSDGTIEGTRRQPVADNWPSFSLSFWRESNGSLYFTMDDFTMNDAHGTELWWIDGDTPTLLDIRPGPESSYPAVIAGRGGVTFLWTGNEPGLWVTDGTQEGTVAVNTTIAGPSKDSDPQSITALNGGFVFTVDRWQGEQFLFSDGTAEGTRQIAAEDGWPPPLPFGRGDLTPLGDKLYYASWREIWSTDGSDAGTVLVWSHPSTNKSVDNLTVHDGKIYFTLGNELWTSDGTTEGTLLVNDMKVPFDRYYHDVLAVVNDLLYFVSEGPERYLWKSDGTREGTQLVKTIPGIPPDRSVRLYPAEDQLFMVVPHPDATQIWRSDGSSEGTLKILETDARLTGPRSVRNRFVFAFQDAESGHELWTSDGTVEGTGLLKHFVPGQDGSFPVMLTTVDDTLYFGTNGGLWKTDGTKTGTKLVKNLQVYVSFSLDAENINGLLYFGASDGETGRELWRSDGTEEGTVRLTDIAPGAASSRPKYPNLTEVDGYIYFEANDGFHGHELWRIPVDPLPGDADGNGVVDFNDFLRLSANFGRDEDVVFADGDFDENGTIEFADFLILSANFGRQGAPVTMQSAERDSAALSTMVVESWAEELEEDQVPIEMLPSPLG